jgi:hypothetical protein
MSSHIARTIIPSRLAQPTWQLLWDTVASRLRSVGIRLKLPLRPVRVNRISLGKRTLVSLSSLRKTEYLLTIDLATQGGGGISPTFGAALWILDYVMQTVIMGTKVRFLSLVL